ncbi:hypothetical protein [Marilutibacter spongiae]|uniref:Uncharacterized protein n=1 Tax=Marilutibacter spongiae TaxID=2025720 RepID=A0A7W3Y5X0_9GAMM|nr:hypothetical protein [Lysobacter spongiae]MBB1060376.1 hypothetical protein [Lysobacter spongiae]
MSIEEQKAAQAVDRYFAADASEGDFGTFATLDEARSAAERMLFDASDSAADYGWENEPPRIYYGELMGHCLEESRMPAPGDSDFEYYVTFGLHPITKPVDPTPYTHEDVMRLVEADMEYDEARRLWEFTTGVDPDDVSDEEWKSASTRIEEAIANRHAALAAFTHQSQGGAR